MIEGVNSASEYVSIMPLIIGSVIYLSMVRGEFEAFVVSSANYWHGLRNKGRRKEQVADLDSKRKSKLKIKYLGNHNASFHPQTSKFFSL